MSSSIEKALQKQKDAAAQKKAQESHSDSIIERGNQRVQSTPSQTAASSEKTVPASAVMDEELKQRYLEINLDELEERGFVSVTNARRLINEEYREIKRKLLKNAFGTLSKTLHNSNIIMVSSARPSEGKTFTAVNLALSIASEQDKTVLLVDADVLKPNVSRTLRIKPDDGLMEYLLDDKKDIADVLYRTNVDKLKIIPAGRTHHLSTELLASERMSDTIDEFANRYSDRIVIIDTPPLVGINESAVLASFAGQAVIVTEEGRSKLNDINTVVDRLNPDMAVGFVVNKAVNERNNSGGYYGYYYGSSTESE